MMMKSAHVYALLISFGLAVIATFGLGATAGFFTGVIMYVILCVTMRAADRRMERSGERDYGP